MRVRILTDSAAALDPDAAARHGLTVVPIRVRLGTEDYADGDLPDEELERRYDEGVTTSAPSPGAWLTAMEQAGGQPVVCVTVAERLSASHQSARLAAEMASGRVRVVDSGTAAGAQALVVIAAARAAAAGGDLDEVTHAADRAAGQVRLVGTLASLDRLVRSGRVPGVAGAAGRALGVNPLFELTAGRVRPHLPAFSRRAALGRLLDTWRASARPGAVADVVVSHALAEAEAATLLRELQADERVQLAMVGRFGAALLAHAGPGTLGLSWRWLDRPVDAGAQPGSAAQDTAASTEGVAATE